TQNIDGLHQAAGSRKVYELHGSVHCSHCMKCRKKFDLAYIMSTKGVARCDSCGGVIKPDVVLYEESLDDNVIMGAVRAIAAADVMIIGGTSLTVYPAAGLVNYYTGDKLVLINMTPTSADSLASLVIREPIGQALGI
ncbi:MAG TPA: Sir2 family NAD-dependent protein deacetylase, partial [Bacillota bacterium]|nr:Sir2 family NAD-dependent protein deacetylase [Bacillota bacterium]